MVHWERVRLADMILFLGIMSAWAVSLSLPVFTYAYPPHAVFDGWMVLTSGYFHLIVFELSWLANFLIVTGLVTLLLMSKPTWSLRCHAFALLSCFVSALANVIFMRFFEWSAVHAGFWLWETTILVCSAWFYSLSRRTDSPDRLVR